MIEDLTKAANIMATILDDPGSRILIGSGLGSLIAGLNANAEKQYPNRSPEEKLKQTITAAIRGALLGGGAGAIPTMLGVNFIRR